MIPAPWPTILVLVLADALALAAAYAGGIAIRLLRDNDLSSEQYLTFALLGVVFLGAYAAAGLYPGIPHQPASELRRLCIATSLVCLALGAATFLARSGLPPRSLLIGTWACALALVPIGRFLARRLAARASWWGVPVVVLGAGATGRQVVEGLLRRPQLGFRPVALFDDDPAQQAPASGVPVIGPLSAAESWARARGVRQAFIAMPGLPPEQLVGIVRGPARGFARLAILPVFHGLPTLWVTAQDLGGVLALDLRQNLLLPGPRALKRLLDLVLVLPALLGLGLAVLVLAPFLLPSGPLFYGQPRLGRGGRRFRCWKFRTMVRDADAVLARHLAAHPELQAEWERDHKLKRDPRVTAIGRVLRRFSIDELPQFWNVLVGQMSLVGPRAIVDAEIAKYGDEYALYTQVRPGISGLWQVSGRNDTTYAERVALDAYYVRNWSPWLDLVIIARTPAAVAGSSGAY